MKGETEQKEKKSILPCQQKRSGIKIQYTKLTLLLLLILFMMSTGIPIQSHVAYAQIDFSTPHSFGQGMPIRIETNGIGVCIAVWVWSKIGNTDYGDDTDIFYARSTDYGVSWSDPTHLNGNAKTDSRFEANPQIATDGNGNWLVVYESNEEYVTGGINVGTDYDILFSRSVDNGKTWTGPLPLNKDYAVGSSTNSHNPEISTDKNGTWAVVWYNAGFYTSPIGGSWPCKRIMISKSTNNGTNWTYPGNIHYQVLSVGSSYGFKLNPDVATALGGNWVVVWDSEEDINGIGDDWDIIISRSTNYGDSWTTPKHLNAYAKSDTSWDWLPIVATDGKNWQEGKNVFMVVWASNFNCYGHCGNDFDILFSRSSNGGSDWDTPKPLNSRAYVDPSGDYPWTDTTPHIATDGRGK